MRDIPLGALSLKGSFGIERILDFSMEERMGGHSFARITGMAQMTDSGYWGFEGAIANKEVEVSICGEETPLFTGIIQEVEAAEENGLHLVKLCIASGSILLDLTKKSRSYQDVGLTYGEVIDQVLAPWDTAAIYPEEFIRLAIGFPIIQYRETDWEFIERLASRFHLSLYPEPVMRGAKLYLGIPETGDARQLDEDEYVVHMDRRFYELGGDEYGFSRYQFVTYEVTSGENCRVGDGVDFHGQELFVCAKSGRAEGGQLVFTYVLAHSDWAASKRRGNQRFSGLSLLGTVESCEKETVRLRLDVDAGCPDQPLYPWTWVPETGNIMYMMPQAGSRVSLYFKGDEEESAIAVNCIRSGNGCAGADYRDKSLVTEHGMKMRLSQADMGFETLTNKVLLDDLSGIRMEGSGAFHILAAGDVMMSGDSVTMSGTDGVAFYQGTAHVTENQPPTLEIKAKIELSGKDEQSASNSRGKLSTYYLAWEHDDYSNPRYRFKDKPEMGKFDTMKEVRNVVGGIAVVIGAAALVYGTFGAGVFIEGIAGGMAGGEALAAAAGSGVAIDMAAATMVGGLLTVGGMAASDLMNGHISSAEEYRRAALLGSITGFLTGAAGLMLADAGLLANMSAGFGIGFTQEAADSYFDDGEIDWEQCVSNGVFAAAMSGIFYKWHGGGGKGGSGTKGSGYSGDMMSPEEAARYSEYWRKQGIGSDNTWNAFAKDNPNATIDDYFTLVKEQSPWPAGYNPKQVTLNSGDTFEMALGVGQPPSMPGRFATTSGNITDVNYVRTNLAVKGEWKPEIDRVVGYKVKEGITLPSLQGPVGPQIDLPLDTYLPGGAEQINIILDRSANAMDYFDITFISKIN